jgi:hypothetical protein
MSLAPGYEPHLSVRELSWQMVFARRLSMSRWLWRPCAWSCSACST